MSKLKCIIIEDEPLAVKILTDYINEISFLDLQGNFKDAIRATEFLYDHTIDLIFLDIHLPKLKGMAFLKSLKNPPSVIVTTAYHQYAVEGFHLNVVDYLLKPIEFERFLAAVNKVKTAHPEPKMTDVQADRDYIFIQVDKKKVRILYSEILYIESQLEYIKVVTTDKTFISKMSTHEMESLLPGNLFVRIHRSYIISIKKIKTYTAELVELPGATIPIGRGYRDELDKF